MEITAGLICENGELFGLELNGQPKQNYIIIGGQCMKFIDAPQIIHDTVDNSMSAEDKECLDELGITEAFERRDMWVSCNVSNKDTIPDYVLGHPTLKREFTNCSVRAICIYQGKLCRTQSQLTGLTPTEVTIMKAIYHGLLDKEIAHLLGISELTVKTHTQNIRIKTGTARKADLVRIAQKLNLTQNV